MLEMSIILIVSKSTESIVSKKIVKDHMISHSVKPQISKVSLKRNELLEVSKSLDEEFVATIREAEKDERNCFTLLAKGNALER